MIKGLILKCGTAILYGLLAAPILGPFILLTSWSNEACAASPKSAPKKKVAPKLDSETKTILGLISSRYQAMGNWEATFTQESFSTGLGKGTLNQGRLHFVRPDKFRFSLFGPEQSEFVSDGKKAWSFQFKDGRAKPPYVRVFNNLKDLEVDRFLIFLRGIDAGDVQNEKKLMASFEVHGRLHGEELELELLPLEAIELVRMKLFFKRTQPNLDRATFEDAIGNTTTIKIITWQKIKQVDPSLFNVVIPASAKVEEIK